MCVFEQSNTGWILNIGKCVANDGINGKIYTNCMGVSIDIMCMHEYLYELYCLICTPVGQL